MTVERIIFKKSFQEKRMTQWACPLCNRGVLEDINKTFQSKETTQSKHARGELGDIWEPDMIELTYSCSLVCGNSQCKEQVNSIGIGSVDYRYEYDVVLDEEPQQVFIESFTPKYFLPHLKIFDIPEKTPDGIKDEINKSFELFFTNPAAAANQTRKALEKILDSLKIKKYAINAKKERYKLSLHARLKQLPSKYEESRELFLAMKWVGNDGSHGDVLTDDVLDIYEILEDVLNEVFQKRTKRIRKIAKQVNMRKGSRS